MSDPYTPEALILSSVAVGFVRGGPSDEQPTHYLLTAIKGPLLVRWPSGQWYEISVKAIEEPTKGEGNASDIEQTKS